MLSEKIGYNIYDKMSVFTINTHAVSSHFFVYVPL